MKKVITIHINGTLFHMEEDAFAAMRESLFRQGKQGDKVTEALLAEKFNALLTPGKQVITIADIQAVLPQLGIKVTYQDTNVGSASPFETEPKRAYRKMKGKVIGGVCEGLGEYWDLDPVIIRIIFLALIFGLGTGILLYLLLWIILPAKI